MIWTGCRICCDIIIVNPLGSKLKNLKSIAWHLAAFSITSQFDDSEIIHYDCENSEIIEHDYDIACCKQQSTLNLYNT